MNDELVPVDKVLKDMHDPNGGPVSWSARDYYYIHYATAEERKEMDKEDRLYTIVATLIRIAIVAIAIWCVIDFLGNY